MIVKILIAGCFIVMLLLLGFAGLSGIWQRKKVLNIAVTAVMLVLTGAMTVTAFVSSHSAEQESVQIEKEDFQTETYLEIPETVDMTESIDMAEAIDTTENTETSGMTSEGIEETSEEATSGNEENEAEGEKITIGCFTDYADRDGCLLAAKSYGCLTYEMRKCTNVEEAVSALKNGEITAFLGDAYDLARFNQDEEANLSAVAIVSAYSQVCIAKKPEVSLDGSSDVKIVYDRTMASCIQEKMIKKVLPIYEQTVEIPISVYSDENTSVYEGNKGNEIKSCLAGDEMVDTVNAYMNDKAQIIVDDAIVVHYLMEKDQATYFADGGRVEDSGKTDCCAWDETDDLFTMKFLLVPRERAEETKVKELQKAMGEAYEKLTESGEDITGEDMRSIYDRIAYGDAGTGDGEAQENRNVLEAVYGTSPTYAKVINFNPALDKNNQEEVIKALHEAAGEETEVESWISLWKEGTEAEKASEVSDPGTETEPENEMKTGTDTTLAN